MTHKELVEIAYRWCLRNARCGIAFKELNCTSHAGEIPDVIGFSSWQHSVVIECKVSRSDFLGDKEKKFRKNPELGMGKFRFYCCPEGLIKKDELPTGWGLIYVNVKGKAKIFYSPFGGIWRGNKVCFGSETGHSYCMKSEHQLLYSALRRLFIRGLFPEIYRPDYKRSDVKQLIERNEIKEN